LIKRISLSEQVLGSVLNYITEHNLVVGDKLPTEGEFAELFSVSRTSIREALKALSINGAVISIPGKGTFLQSKAAEMLINREGLLEIEAEVSISEIMEVRTALEVLACELAIERASDEEIRALRPSLEALESAVRSGSSWTTAGGNFHNQIAEMAGNKLLCSTNLSLAQTVDRYKAMLEEHNIAMAIHVQDHWNIYEALLARDRAAAREAMSAHMRHIENDLKNLVDTHTAHRFLTKK